MQSEQSAHDGAPLVSASRMRHMQAHSIFLKQVPEMRPDDRSVFERSVLSQAAYLSANAVAGLFAAARTERHAVAEDLHFFHAAPKR